jgi:glycine/D-amino acid oxidase-like deaminating enzyme
MMQNQVDYLIVGQGIAGTLLSAGLLRRGNKVRVVAPVPTNTASWLSSALIQPLAGKKLSTRPSIATEMSTASGAYKYISDLTGTTVFAQSRLLQMHQSEEERQRFAKEFEAGNSFLFEAIDERAYSIFNRNDFGAHTIAPVFRIFPELLLGSWREYLSKSQSLLEEQFAHQELQITENQIAYKGLQAKALIFCEGNSGRKNPFFSTTTMNKNRGELLLLSIPDLDDSFVYQGPLRLVPKGEGLWWCGSNYRWEYEDLTPDAQWREASLEQLRNWLRLPFTLLDHCVAERPTTAGQQPLLLQHPEHRPLFLFNGLGTRGFSAGPFLAEQMADQITRHPNP